MPFELLARTKLILAFGWLVVGSAAATELPSTESWTKLETVSGRYLLLAEVFKALDPGDRLKLRADQELANLKVHLEVQDFPIRDILSSVASTLQTSWRLKPDGYWVLEFTTQERISQAEYQRAKVSASYRAWENVVVSPQRLVQRLTFGDLKDQLARVEEQLEQTKEAKAPGWQARADSLAETAEELEAGSDVGRYAATFLVASLSGSPRALFDQESRLVRFPAAVIATLKTRLGRADFDDCFLVWHRSPRSMAWTLTTVFVSPLNIESSKVTYTPARILFDDSHRTAWATAKDRFADGKPIEPPVSPSLPVDSLVGSLRTSLNTPVVLEAVRTSQPFSDNLKEREALSTAPALGAHLTSQLYALALQDGWCIGRLAMRPHLRDLDAPETLVRAQTSSSILDLDGLAYTLVASILPGDAGSTLVPSLVAPGSTPDLLPVARFWLALTTRQRSEALAGVPIAYESLSPDAKARFQSAFFANLQGTGGDEFKRSDLLVGFADTWDSMYFYIDPYVSNGILSTDGVTTVFSTPDQAFVAPPPGTKVDSDRTQLTMYFGSTARKAQTYTLIANKKRD
jgi:hypothetical protein